MLGLAVHWESCVVFPGEETETLLKAKAQQHQLDNKVLQGQQHSYFIYSFKIEPGFSLTWIVGKTAGSDQI